MVKKKTTVARHFQVIHQLRIGIERDKRILPAANHHILLDALEGAPHGFPVGHGRYAQLLRQAVGAAADRCNHWRR